MQDEVVEAIRFHHPVHTGLGSADTYFSSQAGWRFEFKDVEGIVRMTHTDGRTVIVCNAGYTRYVKRHEPAVAPVVPPPAPTAPAIPASKARPPFQGKKVS